MRVKVTVQQLLLFLYTCEVSIYHFSKALHCASCTVIDTPVYSIDCIPVNAIVTIPTHVCSHGVSPLLTVHAHIRYSLEAA